ncbi:tetraacyldisaccharide 4'-kinase [Thermosulfidibacter takaii ABI70S6]|uniref:Tetraacyldisaccharide 4'-kinase n=1 Tax=Thermosulfidibacter takaii (strain DSM 17441 / JCM 13301 / NBRC 103674 / ABI70S6) TaxID=1298851 RepID=A0A0S3QTY9_THET7|nr:tetraacyldisaccharide 4'-kinase [Thermosulfidibacter takaii ABI70S6]
MHSKVNQWGYSNNTVYKLLYPLSCFYRLAVNTRNILYDQKFLQVQKLPVPTISVGNITLGGTGKTPLVIGLCKYLKELDYNPCVLSRGYGRKRKEEILVCDGKRILASASESGDEPFLIATKTKAIVAVGSDRYKAFKLAENLSPDVVILDDGFQHRKIERDLDLCLIDGTRCFGNGHLLPAGPLREPIKSLHRCDAIIITKQKNLSCFEKTVGILSQKPVFFFTPTTELTSICDREHPSKPTFITAIANPEAALEELKKKDINPYKVITFADHHWFTEKEFDYVGDEIITTEKDLVKFPESIKKQKKIWVLRFVEVLPEDLKTFIRERLCLLKGKSDSRN